MRHLYVIVLFVSAYSHGFAMGLQDTIIEIQEVEIAEERYSHVQVGMDIQIIRLDSFPQFKHQSIAQTLASETNISLKTYGPGGLTNMSIRGGGTSHSAVLWNGLNLQSPMNAGTNLSQFPSFFFEEIIVQKGGSSTFHGSGAVAGVLQLATASFNESNPNISFSQSIGSFGNYTSSVAIKTGSEKFRSQLKIVRGQAKNNFEFVNHAKYLSPFETQTNAELKQSNILLENQIKTSRYSKLFFGAWIRTYDKNIQTLMTDYGRSIATQLDEGITATANYSYKKNKTQLTARTGYIESKSLYENPTSLTYAQNDSRAIINDFEFEYKLNKTLDIIAGANHTFETAESGGYQNIPKRNRSSILTGLQTHLLGGKLSQTVSLRYENIQGIKTKPVYALSNVFQISNGIQIKASLGTNYRIPSMNDLYWANTAYASGNPNLKPEYGIGSNIGIAINRKLFGSHLKLEHHFFHMNIEDWIIWLPDQVGKWTPQNLNRGISKGFETRIGLSRKLNNWSISISSSYQLTHAISESSDEYNDKQIIYVPRQRVGIHGKIAYKKISLSTSNQFTGERNYDANNMLEAYKLSDFHFFYPIKIKNTSVECGLSILNAFNTNYQVMAWYAMPQRNFLFTLNLNL